MRLHQFKVCSAVLILLSLMTGAAFARTVETENFSLEPETAPPNTTIRQNDQTLIPNRGDVSTPTIRISHDTTLLPDAVQSTRQELIEIARNGRLEALNDFIARNGAMPVVAYDEITDPVEYLRDISGDEGGQEILAIMLEILQVGYAHEGEGTDAEIFVWPYFTGLSLSELSARQRVELFTLVTAGDYEDMQIFGAYNFFRLGISRDGKWQFFISGD